MFKRKNKLILINVKHAPLLVVLFLYGCSIAAPIQDADTSEPRLKPGEYSVRVGYDYSDNQKYRTLTKHRIYHQAATGFVSIGAIRRSLLKRANEYCKRQDKTLESVSEVYTKLYPGVFPQIEVVFVCVQGKKEDTTDRYDHLIKLKSLLDSSAITQEEFNKEKALILD
jgi:hypothetical protein